MLSKKSACKYEYPFKGPYKIVKIRTNKTVTLQTGLVTTIMNIRRIKPYHGGESEWCIYFSFQININQFIYTHTHIQDIYI